DGTPQSYTRAQALALTPADLADVVGVTVTFACADGSPAIGAGASATAELVFQLREQKRSGGPVEITSPGGEPILNQAHVQAESPGRIECVTPTTPACSAGTASDEDEFNIVGADFAVVGAKSINPASIYEDQSKAYTTTLVGQPMGAARATL